ncbi:putative phage tail protein [Novacetimonas hansenii]|uniref:Phage tail protein n=1 Tax=Novacetimonas hansenii TaxID=436 RepID=A0ABQ0SGU8_NOVHA|nr:putative phage tail protein [Novacetimonas hansenii]GAN84035.1 bacteriophage tail protein [Novacetimonas hansenii JCM 7643]GBQ55834.1 hypothetical protein AA0243_1023 [Novacetimonas hansenii NRIC 0243]GEC64615.1 hypothetical protein GHA01_24640 [Novacetimonas hansenii]
MAEILQTFTEQGYSYPQAFKNLLPTGFAWPKDEDTFLNDFAKAIGLVFEDMDTLSCETIDEVFPGTTTVLLPMWQETLGITPEPTQTIEEQRQQVIAMLTATGSISNSYFINLAKQLGYEMTIIEYGAIVAGIYRIGDEVGTTNDYSYEFDVTFVVNNSDDYSVLESTFQSILPSYVKVYYISVNT